MHEILLAWEIYHNIDILWQPLSVPKLQRQIEIPPLHNQLLYLNHKHSKCIQNSSLEPLDPAMNEDGNYDQ